MLEMSLRQTLIDWLRFNASLMAKVNAVEEEAPLRSSEPWLGVVSSASADWSTKTERGCEIRIAIEVHLRGDRLDTGSALLTELSDTVAALPAQQNGFRIVGNRFLRGRVEQRPGNLRAALLEYRFRLLET